MVQSCPGFINNSATDSVVKDREDDRMRPEREYSSSTSRLDYVDTAIFIASEWDLCLLDGFYSLDTLLRTFTYRCQPLRLLMPETILRRQLETLREFNVNMVIARREFQNYSAADNGFWVINSIIDGDDLWDRWKYIYWKSAQISRRTAGFPIHEIKPLRGKMVNLTSDIIRWNARFKAIWLQR